MTIQTHTTDRPSPVKAGTGRWKRPNGTRIPILKLTLSRGGTTLIDPADIPAIIEAANKVLADCERLGIKTER